MYKCPYCGETIDTELELMFCPICENYIDDWLDELDTESCTSEN